MLYVGDIAVIEVNAHSWCKDNIRKVRWRISSSYKKRAARSSKPSSSSCILILAPLQSRLPTTFKMSQVQTIYESTFAPPAADSFSSGPDTSIIGITSQALKLDRNLRTGTRFTPIVYQTARVSGVQQLRCQVSIADKLEREELSRSCCQTRGSQG